MPHLYHTPDHTRWFLIPTDASGPPGSLAVEDVQGNPRTFHPLWIARFEVSEEQARAAVSAELGETLDELRTGVDDKLAGFRAKLDELKASPVVKDSPYTADALPAIGALLMALPGLVGGGLSGDTKRQKEAGKVADQIAARLREAGIDVGDSLSAFPDKIASIRNESGKSDC
jgi:hypothetical protein